jgi:hypothetical protein
MFEIADENVFKCARKGPMVRIYLTTLEFPNLDLFSPIAFGKRHIPAL